MIVFYELAAFVVTWVLLSLRRLDHEFVRAVKNIITALVYNLLLMQQQFLFVQVFRKVSIHSGLPSRAALSVCFHL